MLRASHPDRADWTVGFVGAGVMAGVMIDGLIQEGVIPAANILASDRKRSRLEELHTAYGIRTSTDNAKVAAEADLLVLAIKPQNLAQVLAELKGHVRSGTLVLSIIAGARMAAIRGGLEHHAVVRCMPNLPCRIREGMTVWYASPDAPENTLHRVEDVLGVMGRELRVYEEGHVDRATAINGTGPAIVAEFVKAMLEAAAYIGEPRDVAQETVLATLMGTARMIEVAHKDGTHVADLIDQVTSPGGTTSRSLQVLKQGGFGATLTDAIDAAYRRTQELGDELEASLAAARHPIN